MTCGGGNWHHYPEILSIMLGSGYVVNNTGDGGAILGCDAASAAIAGGNSFCKSGQYTNFTNPAPDIVIIGPFGEHDQRILAGNAMFTTFYTEAAFEAAYDGLIKKYVALKPTVKIYMMTPIDVTFNAGALPAGDDIVKDVMLAASKAAATKNNVPIIDTNAMVGMSYYATDGQVNAAGQMKMATMIVAALQSGGTGGRWRRGRRGRRRGRRERRGRRGGGAGGARAARRARAAARAARRRDRRRRLDDTGAARLDHGARPTRRRAPPARRHGHRRARTTGRGRLHDGRRRRDRRRPARRARPARASPRHARAAAAAPSRRAPRAARSVSSPPGCSRRSSSAAAARAAGRPRLGQVPEQVRARDYGTL